MKIYKSLQFNRLTYVAPALQAWAAPFRNEQLERSQNRALRVVKAQLKSIGVETLQRKPSPAASSLRLNAQQRWSERKPTD